MPFQGLIFGPRHSPREIPKFDNREQINSFCADLRSRFSSGASGLGYRLSQIYCLERQGLEASHEGNYNDAFHFYGQAAELRGDYSMDSYMAIINILMANGRYADATALSFVAIQKFPEESSRFELCFYEAYFHLGYTEIARLNFGSELWFQNVTGRWAAEKHLGGEIIFKSFDDHDAEETLTRFSSLDEIGVVDWNMYLFATTHLLVHLELRGSASQNICDMIKKSGFMAKISRDTKLRELFSRPYLDQMNQAELRFMTYFFVLLNRIKKLGLKLPTPNWLRNLLKRFASGVVVPGSCRKMAFCQPGNYRQILSEFLYLARPILKFPLSWVCKASLLFIFSGDKVGATPYGACMFGKCLANVTFDSSMLRARDLDLLILYCQINFAEWKRSLLNKPLMLKSSDIIYAPRTFQNQIDLASNFLLKIALNGAHKNGPNLNKLKPVFLFFLEKFDFLAENVENLNDDGRRHLRKTIDFLNAIISHVRKSQQHAHFLINIPSFAKPLNTILVRHKCSFQAGRFAGDQAIVDSLNEFKLVYAL